MKKYLLMAVATTMLFSCQNEDSQSTTPVATLHRTCATPEVLEAQLKTDPGLAMRMKKIEAFTQKALLTNKLVLGKIVIPVVVNVLYSTPAENISLAQIQSQIAILNQDFNATNPDYALVPPAFTGLKANVGISFTLATTDIHRKATTKSIWTSDDSMKKVATGGLAAVAPTTKLNIWLVGGITSITSGNPILGYAYAPGVVSTIDGVVIDSNYFGYSGAASYPYNLGRTATHEIGHWMNLKHIWGDANCGDDLVSDTPQHDSANFGVPIYPHYSLCTGNPIEMTMDYMDYTDDRGMYMFSDGQKRRMETLFIVGGARASFRK